VTNSAERKLPILPAVAPINLNNVSTPQIPFASVELYPVSENRRYGSSPSPRAPPHPPALSNDIINGPNASRRPQDMAIQQPPGLIRRPMIKHIEDIRRHHLPRYYELLNQYYVHPKPLALVRLRQQEFICHKPQPKPQNPAAEQADRPNLPMLLCHVGEHIRSRNALAIAAAAREGGNLSQAMDLQQHSSPILRSSPKARGNSRGKRIGCTAGARGDGGGEDGLGASHGAIY
jgi:hypothetical protein